MALPMGLEEIVVTITSGTSLSPSVGLGAKSLVGVAMPASGWDAADLTFQVCADGTTFLEFYDGAGNAVDLSAAAGRYMWVDPAVWNGVNLIKLRSGTSGAAVTQNADRVITLVVKPL